MISKCSLFTFSRFQLMITSFRMSYSKVYVRNAIGDDRIQLSLTFPPNGLKARVYNFDRLRNEELGTTLARISANISKFMNKKKKPSSSKDMQSENPLPDLDVVLLGESDLPVDASEQNDRAWLDGRFLMVDNVRLLVSLNVPTVKKLELPEVLMVGFAVSPIIHVEFGDVHDLHCVWFRRSHHSSQNSSHHRVEEQEQLQSGIFMSDNLFELASENELSKVKQRRIETNVSHNWEQIHIGKVYVPVDADEKCDLKFECRPVSGDRVGEIVSKISKPSVFKGPLGSCPFEKRHLQTTNVLGNGCFRFVTYNILAYIYADSDFSRDVLFPYCPTYALSMEYRKLLLIKELTGYNSDIMCLQEVDKKVFDQDLSPHFEELGFSGLLSLKSGDVAEGTATFFRNSKFRLISQHNLTLSKALQEDPLYADISEKLSKSKSLQDMVYARTSVLQVSLLESTEDRKQQVLVATVHMYFHPRAPHVRILQAAVCIRHLERVLEYCSRQSCSRPAVIFCGDFNSHSEGGVHDFIADKRISAKHSDWYAGGKDEYVEDMELHHSLDLISACGFPRYTNFVGGFRGCLDYIYIEPKYLNPVAVIPLPSHEDVTKFTALPNVVFPSDHLALVCDLAYSRDMCPE